MRIATFLTTVSHLKWKQVYYQFWYRIKSRFTDIARYTDYADAPVYGIVSTEPGCFAAENKWLGDLQFDFLHQRQTFHQRVDWNFLKYGKLWNYNLQYFDFLHDRSLPANEREKLVVDFAEQFLAHKIKAEPYPVSLRIVNWLIFSASHPVKHPSFDEAIRRQVSFLRRNLEFHIMANHLLENYIALFIAAISLRNEGLLAQAEKGLEDCLAEQVLQDGGHYECSPMYHCILLSRLLLLVDILRHNDWPRKKYPFISEKASAMLGWLYSFCWRNRSFAFLNDATDGIAPPPDQLFNIAGRLQLPFATIQLKDSGYRKMDNGQFEVLVDAGNIIPAYQPGHAHSDMLSVCFMHNGNPVLTDTGISTYEPVSRRYEERRTAAHNTVVIEGLDQSEVWNSFRVGRRAHCSILKDEPVHVCAEHNGYKRSAGILHRRSVELNAKRLTIMDELIRLAGSNRKFEATALFHFNHGIEPVPISAWEYKISDSLILKLQGDCRTEIASYSQASGFNKVVNAKKLIVSFEGKLVSVFESV